LITKSCVLLNTHYVFVMRIHYICINFMEEEEGEEEEIPGGKG